MPLAAYKRSETGANAGAKVDGRATNVLRKGPLTPVPINNECDKPRCAVISMLITQVVLFRLNWVKGFSLVGFGATPRGFDLPPCGAGNGVGIFRGMLVLFEGQGVAPKKGFYSANFILIHCLGSLKTLKIFIFKLKTRAR
jgi:hypothetical protein